MKNLKNKYDTQLENPSPLIWEKIEEKLDGKTIQRKTIFHHTAMFWKVASVVVLMGGIVWLGLSEKENKTQFSEKKSVKKTENLVLESKKIIPEQEKNPVEIETITTIIKEPTATVTHCNFDLPPIREKNEIHSSETAQNSDKIVEKIDLKEEKTEYISANDLMFGREIEKVQTQQKNTESIANYIPNPKEIEIMGIKIYQKK